MLQFIFLEEVKRYLNMDPAGQGPPKLKSFLSLNVGKRFPESLALSPMEYRFLLRRPSAVTEEQIEVLGEREGERERGKGGK